jgi:hypothetical protein
MKKICTLFFSLLLAVNLFAQTPQKISYQAVIRNSSDQLVTNHLIGMQVSILQGSPSGTPVYIETLSTTSNANGLVSVEIGSAPGFDTIHWNTGTYYIKTETDPTGSTAYTITGITQILSVPYALHAETAESLSGGITETDPVFTASPANGITSTNMTNWNTAYSWGNHASAGYLTSYTETDPVFVASPAHSISNTNITNWNTAYGWGNHASAGYLTSYTETDPVFVASPAHSISNTNITNWNTAYSWGNHASAGYLTSYTETDPIFTAMVNVTSPANGQLLRYNSVSSKWENWTAAYLTTEVDGSVTNEIELPPQASQGGKFLQTNGSAPSWTSVTKTTVGLDNVENTALSTWTGSTNLTTLGTISSGTWQGTAINATYVGNLPASKITSGVFDNARINFAAPTSIGSATPASGAFTSLSANAGLSVSSGTINLRPAGSSGTNGQVLTTDGSGNVSWQTVTASRPTRIVTANTTLTTTDELVIVRGANVLVTLPSSPVNGQVLMISGYDATSGVIVPGSQKLRLQSTDYPNGTYTFGDMNNLVLLVYDSLSNSWFLML